MRLGEDRQRPGDARELPAPIAQPKGWVTLQLRHPKTPSPSVFGARGGCFIPPSTLGVGHTAARTAPGSPSSWSLGVRSILRGRKIPPRRASKALRGREDTAGAHLARGHVPAAARGLCERRQPASAVSAVPYRRRGLQT